MNLAIDVYYRENDAKAVGILFEWDGELPIKSLVEYIQPIEEYEPGKFYKRELPCIMAILKEVDLDTLESIVVDGHVYTNNDKTYGLGGHLWETLNGKVPVIGVAKTSFHQTEEVSIPILRGSSLSPLYVSAIGFDLNDAIQKVRNMKGEFRFPTLLKALDQMTKGG